ncbi:hypothetical protein L6452_41426 [Arctium lappa]|uniref:Uncharacterized protein n=1 Tax=Arctium lappa TaxID=4217 RepID=A0ACB8XT42_ARCLA|nr:hypothetical protein L6452_41426 [Arctium lappa]
MSMPVAAGGCRSRLGESSERERVQWFCRATETSASLCVLSRLLVKYAIDLDRSFFTMGSVCCGLHYELEDYANPNNSMYRNCVCVRCLLQNLLYMRTSLFPRGEEHVRLASPSRWTSSFGSSLSVDNSLSDVYRSPPRPTPYDADPRYLRLQRDEPTSRREKGSSHSQEESEPLRSDGETCVDPLSDGNKPNDFVGEVEEAKNPQTNSHSKLSTSKETTGFAHIYASQEEDDEDVCPTCLEEYTMENPKIITKCSHHFHLGCIYEWMERSETCPVCGKVMEFDETN